MPLPVLQSFLTFRLLVMLKAGIEIRMIFKGNAINQAAIAGLFLWTTTVAFLQVTKQIFGDFGLCGLPFDKPEFNRHLDSMSKLPDWFTAAVFEIPFHSSIGMGRTLEAYRNRTHFLAALLRTPNSTLCQALKENPFSLFNHLARQLNTNQNKTSNSETQSGKRVFAAVFVESTLLEEISAEFATNFDLRQFEYPSIDGAIAISDLFMLRSGATNAECDAFSLMRQVRTRIDEYVCMMSAFFHKIRPTEAYLFNMVVQILSLSRMLENLLMRLLLLPTNNPLGLWIINNYDSVIRLKRESFNDAYLDMLFDPVIYEYIFSTLVSFNSHKKLRELDRFRWKSECFAENHLRYLLLKNYAFHYSNSHNVMLLIEAAQLSRFILNATKMEAKIMLVFDLLPFAPEKNYSFFIYLITVLALPEIIRQKSVDKRIADSPVKMYSQFKRYLLELMNCDNLSNIRGELISVLLLVNKLQINKEKLREYYFEDEVQHLSQIFQSACEELFRSLIKKVGVDEKTGATVVIVE